MKPKVVLFSRTKRRRYAELFATGGKNNSYLVKHFARLQLRKNYRERKQSAISS
jgi:hypothetical protein